MKIRLLQDISTNCKQCRTTCPRPFIQRLPTLWSGPPVSHRDTGWIVSWSPTRGAVWPNGCFSIERDARVFSEPMAQLYPFVLHKNRFKYANIQHLCFFLIYVNKINYVKGNLCPGKSYHEQYTWRNTCCAYNR